MDVAFAGASALEIIRMVRMNPGLQLIPVAKTASRTALMSCEGTHGSASKLNFCALGLSVPPTKSHPAFIRVPRAAHRKRIDAVRCLLFPKGLPDHSLLQLRTVPRTAPENGPEGAGERVANRSDGAAMAASEWSADYPDPSAIFNGSRVYVDSLPLACATIAASYQRLIRKETMTETDAVVQLAALVMEFTGHYGRDPGNPRTGPIDESLTPIATVSDFERFVTESRQVKGIRLLAKALPYARDGSRSAMETCLWIMMALPESRGFYAFTGGKLNASLMFSQTERALVRHKTLTPDILWEAERVAVEYLGFEDHVSKASQSEDARRASDYQICGIFALFVTFDEVRNIASFDSLARQIASALDRSGTKNELARINALLTNPAARGERARQLSRLLPPVRRLG